VVIREQQETGYQIDCEVSGRKNVLQGNVECDCERKRGCVFKMSCAVTVPVKLDSRIMSDGLNRVPRINAVVTRNRTALATRPSCVPRRVVFI